LEYKLIAKVEQVYGKDGYLKVEFFPNFPERFLKLKKVYIDFWGDKKIFHVEDIKNLNGKLIIKFERFDSLRDTSVLIDREIYIDESEKITLPENHFFVHDLIGSEVIVENDKIGIVTDVMKTKANDILVISTKGQKEKLIPFVLNFIEKYDAAKRKLILNVPKDFWEDVED
jgi:16S rRNA processing protein RimM